MLKAPTEYKTLQSNGTEEGTKPAKFQTAYPVDLSGCETTGVLPMSAHDWHDEEGDGDGKMHEVHKETHEHYYGSDHAKARHHEHGEAHAHKMKKEHEAKMEKHHAKHHEAKMEGHRHRHGK